MNSEENNTLITNRQKSLSYLGKRFGKLTILNIFYKNNKGLAYAECICDCGNNYNAKINYITKYRSPNCGCTQKLSLKDRQEKTLKDYLNTTINNVYIKNIKFIRNNRSGEHTPIAQCICYCGKEFVTNLRFLKTGSTLSCGCYSTKKLSENNSKRAADKRTDIIGKVFNKLTAIESNDNGVTWKCKCECGGERVEYHYVLISGRAKSCGCINRNKICYNLSSAKSIYKRYADGNITFEQFLNLTSKNCHYCNKPPNNCANIASSRSKDVNKYDFIYSGLDRVDSFKPHDIDNVVPCCIICNRGKNNLKYDEFLNKIWQIYNNSIITGKIELLKINKLEIIKNYLLQDISPIYHNNIYSIKMDIYKELETNDFLKLSSNNCYYCGCKPSNKLKNKGKLILVYSGLDRVDSSIKEHSNDNCIPCCKSCNIIKHGQSLEDFDLKVKEIYNNLKLDNKYSYQEYDFGRPRKPRKYFCLSKDYYNKYIGKRFDYLIVKDIIEVDPLKTRASDKFKVLCLCNCGNSHETTIEQLVKTVRYIKSCGCMKIRNHININQKFGKLTVIERFYKNNKPFWKCRCECGKERIISSNILNSQKAISCGC